MGVEVVTLSQVTQTLEDIYLKIVEQDERDHDATIASDRQQQKAG